MMTDDCTQAGAAEDAALELFRVAALLLGSESDAVAAVEETVAKVEVDPCADPQRARRESLTKLIRTAIARVESREPHALAPPTGKADHSTTCIETDDLSATGLTTDQISNLLTGSGRAQMRRWLEGLTPALRVVFVLRALLGKSGSAATEYLNDAGAGRWTPAQVSSVFRDALCSLTGSLVHAVTPGAVA